MSAITENTLNESIDFNGLNATNIVNIIGNSDNEMLLADEEGFITILVRRERTVSEMTINKATLILNNLFNCPKKIYSLRN